MLEHIDRHLDEPLELHTLARVANFSAFHFHRLFAAWMGETLGEYLRRRRLEIAAQRLVAQPRLPMLQVALTVGFGSTEAFARAFKARFGSTPSEWRSAQVSNRDQLNRNPDQASAVAVRNHELAKNHALEANMKVKVIDRNRATVAYLRHVGPYGKPISDFWMKTVAPWMETNGLLGQPRYGISHDDPGVTAPEKLRYDAAVEVPADFVGAGHHLKTEIPGGKYAALHFRGTVAEVGPAWESLLRDWLPGSGMQLDSRPFFEYYPTDIKYEPGVIECDICVPITPL